MKLHSYIKALLLTTVIAGPIPAASQQTKILTAEKHNEYGLVYNLPQTALQIQVTARKQTRVGGDFYQYAKKYLGTDMAISENSEAWTITRVKVTPYGIADPESRYLMQLKPGATTFIGVGEDGMLLSINAKPTLTPRPETLEDGSEPEKRPTGKEYLQYVSEDFLASQSKAKQAEMLAASLMEVRDSYIALTRGTADNMPTDGQQLELMLNSLRKQEEALTQAFTGFSYESEESRIYTFMPDEEGRKTLFRLSDFAGFVGADDYSGDPVYIKTKIIRTGELPKDAAGEEKKYPRDGVAYVIPGAAEISMTYKGVEIYSGDFEMAQYGAVFGLSPQLFTSKKEPSYVIFSDVTGGIVEIGVVKPEEE
ncbi:MAG: DUF4831 family protein [Clostridium sp.]|nr:DUF4831 family protein [Prevotella sp.]MCM1428885.1 DUF4831 family protein [Clostridium sp.]MCM1475264.1 DUF4831 family protein [Muribaculaceae bacterium]